jgi:gamma-glutamyl:cysteine ligase YbdK (ATP-grasp superfamily)
MTKLLNKVIKSAKELPNDKQDMVAATILAEISADEKWDQLFAQTTNQQWHQMVKHAQKAIAENGSLSRDEFYNQFETD